MTSAVEPPVRDAGTGLSAQDEQLIRQRHPTARLTTEVGRHPTITISSDRLLDVLTTSRYELAAPGFDTLSDLTAVDLAQFGSPGTMRVSYLLSNGSCRLRITADVAESDPPLHTATGLWPATDWAERELHEMFGIQFSQHPGLRRLLTPDHSTIHPLRKAHPLNAADEEATGDGASGTHAPPPGAVQLAVGAASAVADAALQLFAHVDGNEICAAHFEPGFVHSGFEKLAEQRTYRQIIPLAERLNYHAPYSVSLAFVLAAESLLNIKVPPRAQYGRVILCELARIASHLRALSSQSTATAANLCAAALLEQLESVRDLFAAVEGRRSASGRTRIGGLVEDLPTDFAAAVESTVRRMATELKVLDSSLMRNRIWRRRMEGAGVISAEAALAWGVTGPALRASGLARDVRRSDPYLAYAEFDFEIPVGSSGDAVDRCRVRRGEIEQSISIIRQACNGLPEGDYRLEDHKVSLPARGSSTADPESLIHHFELLMDGHGLRPPAGADVYMPTEAPEGELGFFLLSDGTDRPYRCHLRSPSFFQGQIVERVLTGCKLPAAEGVFVSMNVNAAEMDR